MSTDCILVCLGIEERYQSEHDAAVPRRWYRAQPVGAHVLRRQRNYVSRFRQHCILADRHGPWSYVVRIFVAGSILVLPAIFLVTGTFS